MRKAFFTVAFLFATFTIVLAQKENPLIHPGETIKKALALRDSQKYDEAAQLLLQISKSDTAYVYAQTELASTYLSAKKFNEAVETANRALKERSEYRLRLILIKGNSLDHAGFPDSSIAVYKEALRKYPYSYLLYYNMGITYVNQKKYDLAAPAFQQAVRLNPFHASSHLVLGRMSALMGHYTHAILSIATYLTLEPNSERSNTNLVFLNNFLNNALSADYEKITPAGKNAFEELDQLLRSGVALNKGYKLKLAFDAPVSRQSQLMFESLQYQEKSGDFWMEYYVPYFLEVRKNNYTEPYMYRVLTSAPDKKVAGHLKKKAKLQESMKKMLGEEIAKIHTNYAIIRDGKEQIVDIFLNDDNYVMSIGKYKADGETRYGHWSFFYPNGELREDGKYNDNGKLEGEWFNYNNDGTLSYVENYKNGELEGDYTGYFPTGNKKYIAKYVKNEPLGEVRYFFDCEATSSLVNFSSGNKNGKGISYYKNGAVREEYSYRNDSLNGENRAYYPDGKLKWIYNYSADKLNGKTLDYYPDETIEKEAIYLNNEPDGLFKGYHDNGQLHLTGSYKKGIQAGEWKEYSRKGILKEVSLRNEKGDFDGETKGYDDKGNLSYVFVYDKGKLKQYSYFKDGKEFESGKVGSSVTRVKGYYQDGTLLCEGNYVNGYMEGEWTYYYKSGIKKFIKTFKEGKAHGPYITFYKNGEKDEEVSNVNGELHGYYKKHNINGIVTSEGWYANGKQEGKWIARGEDGTISTENYFVSGNVIGYTYDYAPDAKLQFVRFFGERGIQWMESYDPEGRVVTKINFDGKTNYMMPYMDGKVRATGDFTCGEMNSRFTFYYKDGKTEVENSYLNDVRHGEFTGFYPSGKVKRTGSYIYGKKTGNWKYYHENGTLSRNVTYKNDRAEGIWYIYYDNGKLKSIEKYLDDELTDTAKHYNPQGEFMFAIIYNEGEIAAFQYDGPEGLVTRSILPSDTGTFVSYYKNGQVSSRQPYRYGNFQGNRILYYSNGNKLTEIETKNGLKNGKLTEYYLSGKIRKTESYLNTDYHGTFADYREDGTIESSKEYRNDDAHGTFIYYDKKGNKERTETYWGDILL